MKALVSILITLLILPMLIPLHTASAMSYTAVAGKARGYLTTPQELEYIRQQATQGIEPHRSNVASLVRSAGDPYDWYYGRISGKFRTTSNGVCYLENGGNEDYFMYDAGAQWVYAKVMAYYLTEDIDYARAARDRILDLTDTSYFGGELYTAGNQCVLTLALSLPLWITAADLMADTPVWSTADKAQFQDWLAREAYEKVAWASRSRVNNWGAAGSLTASMIADYMYGRTITLHEEEPNDLDLTPGQAYVQHNNLQLRRMTGSDRMDSQCGDWGIQSYGGIPDELRRGTTGCDGRWIEDLDKSLGYQTTQVELLMYHAEFLLRRGNDMLFDNGALSRAIKFVIANPYGVSVDWVDYRKGTLNVMYAYSCERVMRLEAATATTFKSGAYLPYAPLTHPTTSCRSSVPTAPKVG